MSLVLANVDCLCGCGQPANAGAWRRGHWNRRPGARAAQSARVLGIWQDGDRKQAAMKAQAAGKAGSEKFKAAAQSNGRRALAAGYLLRGGEPSQTPAARAKRTASLKARYADPVERANLLARSPLSANTKPEMAVAMALGTLGQPFQHQYAEGGRVWDFRLADGTILEVDGCYWHGCAACGKGKAHDATQLHNLKRDGERPGLVASLGHRFVLVWEHDTFDQSNLERLLAGLLALE